MIAQYYTLDKAKQVGGFFMLESTKNDTTQIKHPVGMKKIKLLPTKDSHSGVLVNWNNVNDSTDSCHTNRWKKWSNISCQSKTLYVNSFWKMLPVIVDSALGFYFSRQISKDCVLRCQPCTHSHHNTNISLNHQLDHSIGFS